MAASSVEIVAQGRPSEVGGFQVRRSIPSAQRRRVGPFVFLDHMGPLDLAPGAGMDVLPHPHIGLATVTYLFDGEFLHRDSLGSEQLIRPGDVNWMTAGRGIVHSERTPAERRRSGGRVHGLQSWVALPLSNEETEPSFHHHAGSSLPVKTEPGLRLRVIAGTAYGLESPVHVFSASLYVHVTLDAEAELPVDDRHAERAAYVVEGNVDLSGTPGTAGQLLVLRTGASATLRAKTAATVMLIGGAPLDGQRHVWWNFVSSSRERIERAKTEWRERRFPPVPGDDVDFVPLPEK